MKKKFKLDEVDCAVCAGKMEDAIKKLEGVEDATVSFIKQTLTLVADDEKFEEIFEQVVECVKKVEPDCEIIR